MLFTERAQTRDGAGGGMLDNWLFEENTQSLFFDVLCLRCVGAM